MKEIEFFLEMSEQEQRVRLAQKVPTLEEYWRIRIGTSAVGVMIASVE